MTTTDSPPSPGLPGLLFGLTARVSRKQYILAGFALMALKYAVDSLVVWVALHRTLDPRTYLLPSLALREASLGSNVPTSLHATMALITLPFLWVGLSMSIRRAVDAGFTPWIGTAFLMPIFNFLMMLFLSVAPTRTDAPWAFGGEAPFRAPMPQPQGADKVSLRPSVLAVLAATGLGLAMTALSVYGLHSYGTALFFVTPFAMGALSAFVANRPEMRTLGHTLAVSSVAVVFTGMAILMFAIEGAVCLLMAMPIALALGLSGSVIGYMIARYGRSTGPQVAACFLFGLPGFSALEVGAQHPTLREARTVMDIAAPPEVVWHRVVSFTELPPPPEWFFRLGISYPMRARIEGEGVGAVRHCEFSTGPFIEPITRWEAPNRLSFNVTSQPPSMTELSPYRHVNAPHLEGYMVSRRGEFRLTRLPNGGTHLEGSTWYTLAIYPEGYWVVGSELLLHAIHTRVLTHIKNLAEADVAAAHP